MTQATVSFEVGILLCSTVRDFLEERQFKGDKIIFREGSGWLSRVFTIKGNADDVVAISHSIEQWGAKYEADDKRK